MNNIKNATINLRSLKNCTMKRDKNYMQLSVNRITKSRYQNFTKFKII